MQGWKYASLAALIALAGHSGAPASQAAPSSVQQRFEAATAALDAQRWEEALRLFEALESHLADRREPRSVALVRARKAEALVALDRLPEAVAALRLALPALPATDPTLNGDRFGAYLTLGRANELSLNYREAADNYASAAAIQVAPRARLDVYRGLIQTRIFFDAPSALAAADEALALAASMQGGSGIEGQLRTLRGRVFLNMGRTAEAHTELDRAVELLGGLSLRIDIRDILARSDLAIAAMLSGRANAARRYLAMTGAGRMESSSLDMPQVRPLPPCGNGLTPDDVAIVELALAEHGGVASAIPIYSSQQGEQALIFARAAQAWHWLPKSATRLAPMFRATIRVEMRCTTGGATARLADEQEVARWAEANGVPISLAPPTNRNSAQLGRDLADARARSGPNSQLLLPILVRLGRSLELDSAVRAQHWQLALAIATAARTPDSYRLMIARALILAVADETPWGRPDPAKMLSLTARAPVSGDPFLEAVALNMAAERHFADRDMGETAALIVRVRSQPGFAANRALARAVDDLAIAVATAQRGQTGGRAVYDSLQPGSFACTARPPVKRSNGSFTDFPQLALNWGFEGWVEIEPVVGTSEAAVSTRTIAAYPPFVFNEGGTRIADRMRFEPAFVPPGGPCAAMTQRISFQLPR